MPNALLDLANHILEHFDRDYFKCTYPDILWGLTGTDAKFETCYTTALMDVKLVYRHNVVVDSHAIIFKNHQLNGPENLWNILRPLMWANAAASTEMALELFRDILEFKKVDLYENLEKADIVAKLMEVRAKAEAFQNGHHDGSVNAIAIVWIGFRLHPDFQHHLQFLR